MRTAIVTAVTGNYDHQGPQVQTPGVDYIYYTDGLAQPVDSFWQLHRLPDVPLDRRRLAKLPKLHPHLLPELADYDQVIWIDGSMQIMRAQFPHEITSYLDRGIVISPHFDGRNDAYGEATIRPAKYASEPLDAQIEHYQKEGFPSHYGLYECGVMARNMNEPIIQRLGEMWLNQNLVFSYQDQVSLPYCFWRLDFDPDLLPKSFRYMNWVHINAHRSED